MQTHPLRRTMLRLAFVAALLMTVMPSLMRLGGHVHAHGSMPASGAMHAMHAHHHAMAGARAAAPAATVDDDQDDCAYCPLLASLALSAFVLLVLPRQRAPGWQAGWFAVARVRAVGHPCGLGSRGPPLAA